MPTGTLTRKIQCQLRNSVSVPPSNTPAEPPPERTNPIVPIALARSAGSVNRIMISDSAIAETMAPPKPWIARAMIRNPCEFARPQSSDAIVNSTIPSRKMRFWP
jgi:hypothetical protein